MTRGSDPPPGRDRRAATVPLALALALLVAAPAAAEEALRLPVTLADPVRGTDVKIDSGSGATHLFFFATWCPPCMGELPRLGDLADRWARRGYRLVLVAVPTRQSRDRLVQFAQKQRPPGRLAFDEDGALTRELGVDSLPTHLILDAAGRIVHRSGELNTGVEAAVGRLLEGGRRGG